MFNPPMLIELHFVPWPWTVETFPAEPILIRLDRRDDLTIEHIGRRDMSALSEQEDAAPDVVDCYRVKSKGLTICEGPCRHEPFVKILESSETAATSAPATA